MKWGRSFDDILLAIDAQALSPAEHAFTILPQHLQGVISTGAEREGSIAALHRQLSDPD
jgi:hypothetical protein